MAPGGEGAADHDVAAGAARWLADTRLDEAARARARERWLRQQAEEDAALAGTLVALAERGDHVIVATAGPELVGVIAEVGPDAVVVRGDPSWAVARLAALAWVDAGTAARPASDDRRQGGGRRFAEHLALAAADRPPVTAWTPAGPASGVLVACGHDVASLRVSGPGGGRTRYVPLGSLSVVTISG